RGSQKPGTPADAPCAATGAGASDGTMTPAATTAHESSRAAAARYLDLGRGITIAMEGADDEKIRTGSTGRTLIAHSCRQTRARGRRRHPSTVSRYGQPAPST